MTITHDAEEQWHRGNEDQSGDWDESFVKKNKKEPKTVED